MRKTLTTLMAGAALATIAGAASAQPYGGYYPPYPGPDYNSGYGQTATLYELPGFRGRSVVVTGSNDNLSNIDFNDRTGSVRLNGTWRLCEDAGYHSRCVTLSGSIPDLRDRGISGLSSLQAVGDGYDNGGGYGGSGVQGSNSVFFPGPASSYRNNGNYGFPYGGYPYGGYTSRTADGFCRMMGYRSAIYADTSHGEMADVLCRR